MKGLLKNSGFWFMVLALTVLSLVFSGCGGGSGPSGNGGSGDKEPGEIDLAKYLGTWVSTEPVNPTVKFTISEFIEDEDFPHLGKKHYYFKGSVECVHLQGGVVAITDKWSLDNYDHICVEQYNDNSVFLFVKAGHDNPDDGTVDLSHGQWDGNNLRFNVRIIDAEGITVYETASGNFDDVFTKMN